jgi:hypothetical protein
MGPNTTVRWIQVVENKARGGNFFVILKPNKMPDSKCLVPWKENRRLPTASRYTNACT